MRITYKMKKAGYIRHKIGSRDKEERERERTDEEEAEYKTRRQEIGDKDSKDRQQKPETTPFATCTL